MFLSINAATTLLEILARPAAIGRCRELPIDLPLLLTQGRLIERRKLLVSSMLGDFTVRWNNADNVTSAFPLDIVTGAATVALRQSFRQRYLKLARDLTHRYYYNKTRFPVTKTHKSPLVPSFQRRKLKMSNPPLPSSDLRGSRLG